MQLLLDVVSSVNIKRKKPWPKLAWLGQEQDDLYLLDGSRISQLYLPSGKTKKKITKLHNLMNNVCAMNVSQNGQYLCGALCDGKIFIWEKDKDKLQFISGLPKLFNDTDKGNTKNKIFLSSCGTMMLLMVGFKKLFLWQKNEKLFSGDGQDISGAWSQIHHGEYTLPDQSNKETSVDGVFFSDDVVGRCGALSYVFNKGTDLTITGLTIKYLDQPSVTNLSHDLPNQDGETASREVTENMKCSIKWRSLSRPLYGVTPATRVVKGRFVYVCRYSPDGQILAIVLNQKSAKDTRLMFCSTLHATATIVDLKCCGGSEESSGRIWWVSDIAWTHDSLLLIGLTRNGALFITSKLGEPINLVTSGCMMEMGPSLFLAIHPRITIRSFQENIPPDSSEISSGSEKDAFHQKFSVAVHPSCPLLLCSDGYSVTLFQFNGKPDHTEMMTNLIEEVSLFLPTSDHHEVPITSENLKKNPQDVSLTAAFLSRMGTPSEISSAASTLSTSGFGLAKNMEAGIVTFGETKGKPSSDIEVDKMTEQQKHGRARNLLLQALRIGVSCGSHWSKNMAVTMNLVIHTWSELFWLLLEDESNSATLSDKSNPFSNIFEFVHSVFEMFHWDMPYQHCLPWFSQFASSTVKSLVNSKWFGHQEIIDVCLRLLRMAEGSVKQTYTWLPVSNRTTVHLLGDTFSPLFDAVSIPTTSTLFSGNRPTVTMVTNNNLDCKLERSWIMVYNYICKIYQSNGRPKVDSGKDQIPDKQLVKSLCFVQKKLQEINSLRNLVAVNNYHSPLDLGEKLYLEGKPSHAVNLLRKSFYDRGKSTASRSLRSPLKPRLEITAPGMMAKETSTLSGVDVSFVQQDLSSKLTEDTDTLLTILHINLENYDLKSALSLAYSFINTNRHVLHDLLNTEKRLEESSPIFPAVDHEGKVTSSPSSVIVLQLSRLMKYPLAWVVDNCALPLVQELARFMSCYFINLPLTIPVPFQPTSCGDQLRKGETTDVKHLSQQRVTDAVAQQKLEAFWTADHTMELLVVSGLLGEAAWFANRLGDWKIAFLLSVTDDIHRKTQPDLYKLPRAHSYFPPAIEASQPKLLMLTKIKMILQLEDNLVCDVRNDQGSINDENVVVSLHNALEASVVAGLDLVPVVVESLVTTLRQKISKLEWMVGQDFYLPAPPLYCPQPTRNEEEIHGEEMLKETKLRDEIADVVQKILAIYRASNCFLLCAQEYCKHLVAHLNDDEIDALPTVVKELIASDASLHVDTSVDDGENAESSCHFTPDYPESVMRVLRCFQEFCGLMWFLHARDEVALTSRAYSKVKQTLCMDQGGEHRHVVILKCEEALAWLRRLLPFSDFLGTTHHILDGILTLLAELPLTNETVSLLAQYFHTTPPSLSLSTTEKLKRLIRKLRNFSGLMGMGNGESLSVVFQEKCEERRKECQDTLRSPVQDGPLHLEQVFEFCNTLAYQKDSAYLRFLDTFLLITVSKNIIEGDHEEVPLVSPYSKWLELLEISTNEKQKEKTATTPKSSNHSTVGIQRSLSFQDIRRKPRTPLLSPDGADQNDRRPIHRSNSLTDVRRYQKSKLSDELQTLLPRLIWLKRWCSVEEGHKGNQGGNRSVSLLNVATSQAAIRVQVPLRMLVNTLWLIENYYKDFVNAKGRCAKTNGLRVKRRRENAKKSHKKVAAGAADDGAVGAAVTPDDEAVGAAVTPDDETLGAAVTPDDEALGAAEMGAGSRSRSGRASFGTKGKGAPSPGTGVTEGAERAAAVWVTEEAASPYKAAETAAATAGAEGVLGEAAAAETTTTAATTGVCGEAEGASETRVIRSAGTPAAATATAAGEAGAEHRGAGEEAVDGSLASDVFENNQVVHRKLLKRHKRKKNPRMSPQKKINTNIAKPVFTEKQEQPSIIVQDFDSGDTLEDVPTTMKLKKNLFPSSSSVDSKWKGSGSIKEELSLLTFSPSSYSPLVSDGKGINSNSSQSFRRSSREMIPSTDLDSESGVLVGHPLYFTDEKESLSSESLSIGQVRSDFVGLLEPIHVVNSTSSIETKQDEGKQDINSKKPGKKSVQQESSSCEPSDKLHPSFLKRVIRSEMRKFIKSQQAQQKSQSSAVETTEDDILSETLSRDGKSSLLIKQKQNERIADRKKARNRSHHPSSSSRRRTSTRNKPEVWKDSRLSRHTSSTWSRPQETNDSSLSGDKTNMRDKPEEQTGSESSRKPVLSKDDRTNHIVSDHPSSYPAQPMIHEHQIPATPMNGWPFWYQAPFPVAPPWLWPNTIASKMSDDKGIQVCTERSAETGQQDNHELASDTKEVESENKNAKETMDVVVEVLPDTQKEDIKDTVNHVAVQTDKHNDSQDEIHKDNPGKEFTHDEQAPLLPPDKYDQDKDARDSVQEIRKEKDIFEEQLSSNIVRQTTNATNAFKEVQQSGNSRDATTHAPGVFQGKLSGQYFQEIENGDHFGEFTIPILKIPPEVSSPTSSVLPFKIAWPDKTVETNTLEQLSEMPLLQLDDLKERSETKDFVPFPPPVTNVRNVESFPLLNLSTSNERGPNLRNFRFLEVPLNQNLEFPLLYLPEAEKHALSLSASVFVEKDKRTTSKKKSRPSDKKAAEAMSMETRNETMNARARRRHLVKDSAVFRQSNVKSNQERKSSLPKQTSSESHSSGVEPRGTVITVQPVQNSASTNDATKKKKSSSKRRDKLRELNNIIRDLERDISDESDLVLSEVSDLLSQEMKYENFEKKSKLVTRDKTAANSKYRSREETLESTVKITGKEFSRVDPKPSTISNLYKPSAVSARDIHSEIPTTVPEEPSTSDAKVGTVNILRLPVSIQTDAVLQAHQLNSHTFNDLPQSPRAVKTKELSVQTDLNEVRGEDSHSNVCDAGTNTNNYTPVIKQDQPEKSIFPRLPPDVFLNLDVENNARERNLPSSSEDKNTVEEAREESPRMFISVADIGQDAVRRQIQEQNVTLRSDNVGKKKHFESQTEQNLEGHEANIAIPRLSIYSDSEVLQPHETVHKGDPTTVDAFSSLDLQSTGVYPVAFRVSTEKQAQKLSKERLSQRLQEMNEQFDVIDRLTSNMDRDLQRSNMLLRTIDNLNKVTDHVSSEEKQTHAIDQSVFKNEKRPTPNIVNQRDAFKNERKPVWQNPPWTNKPIEKLTELVDNENTEIKKLDSFEAKSADDSEVESMGHIEDTKDTRSDTGQESGSNRESRRSSISSIPTEPRPRENTELPKSTTPRYDTSSSRGLTSVVAPDVLNRSREKLKELLATSTNSAIADLRVRDKTPQKQQELKEWMTKKRKIRHREWTDKLNEQRQAEHNPFQSKSQAEEAVVSSKKIKNVEKERKDNRRAQKKEDVDERLMSAYDLINEMVTEPVPKAPIITHDPTQTARRKNGGKANNRYKDSRRVSGKQPRTKRKVRKTNIGDVNFDRFDTQRRKTKESSLSGLNSQRDLGQTKNAPLYDYDIEDSGRHFITRKSYEKYQNKMSGSYDFERSLSFGRNNMFDVKHSFDSRVDELIDDVSLAETLDQRKLDHLDSLLSGDSELRELLNDVIIERDKPRHDMLTRNDDVISITSRVSSNGIARNNENRLETRNQVERKGTMFGTFRVAPQRDENQRTKYSAENLLPDTESANNWNDVDNLEMSDEVAALLAEAKAAVGDDFSGTSEVGDIDWNEVDNVLQEN